MKHTPKITFYLLCLFVLAQLIGVGVMQSYIDPAASEAAGKTVFGPMDIAGVAVEPPPVEESYSFIYIAVAILIGTGLIFLIIYFRQDAIWKFWYFLAALLTISLALAAFIPSTIAFVLSLIISGFRVYRPNLFFQNISELFMYGGLAAVFVPILNLVSVLALLLFISFYDMYAVWKSKHMITLANYQAKSKLFAGLMIPYDDKGVVTKSSELGSLKRKSGSTSSKKMSKGTVSKTRMVHSAILGGGDIGFPLFFIGVVLKLYGLAAALWIVPFVTVALGSLFYYSEKGKFYPAMPVVSMGCLVGLRIVFVFL